MNVAVIGTGYVGLVTGACFAEMGHPVICVDVDAEKIRNLKQGVLPVSEPGLQPLVARNCSEDRLRFTTSLSEAVACSRILSIAVGTPPGKDSSADLGLVLDVARQIGRQLDAYSVIVVKSTVPVGTARKIGEAIQRQLDARGAAVPFEVVSNPEFLKEGSAVRDFMSPDRIVVGCESDTARQFPRVWHDQGLLQLVDHHYEAAEHADALVLVTEWKVFRNPDPDHLARIMHQEVVFDGRNQYDPMRTREHGFEYMGIGR